jgi:hypothetical protein
LVADAQVNRSFLGPVGHAVLGVVRPSRRGLSPAVERERRRPPAFKLHCEREDDAIGLAGRHAWRS